MVLTIVCPVLERVHFDDAGVGEVVKLVLTHALKAKAAPATTGLTIMLIDFDAAVPAFGVAVSVPEYVAGAVAVVSVTAPQVAFAAQEVG